jgi:predicted PurR-regulated permease PerM
MGKVSGFSPIIVLLAILIAGAFFGAIGAVIAIPITMILVIILRRVLGISNL